MKIKKNNKILNNICLGIIKDKIYFDDADEDYTLTYFVILKKTNNISKIIDSSRYYLYESLNSNIDYYISDNNNNVILYNFKQSNYGISSETQIENFYSLYNILNRTRELLESAALTNEMSLDYLETFLITEYYINNSNEKKIIKSFDNELFMDNIEQIYKIAVTETKESLIKKFSNHLADLNRQKFTVINGNKTSDNNDNKKNREHNLVLVNKNRYND